MDIGDEINGWRIVEDAGVGRSGHVFIVCREGDPDRLFALKMQRTDISEQSDMYALAMVLMEHCPKRQRDCFDPVLRECLRPAPADRPRSALDMATRLRTCKPPHHRFRAIVKWTALAFASAVFVYGIVMFGSYHTRRERSQRLYPGEITAGAHYRSGCILLERGDVTNAVMHLNDAARLGNAKAKEMLRRLRLAP